MLNIFPLCRLYKILEYSHSFRVGQGGRYFGKQRGEDKIAEKFPSYAASQSVGILSKHWTPQLDVLSVLESVNGMLYLLLICE